MASTTSGPQIFDDASRAPAKPSVFKAMLSSKHRRNQSANDVAPVQPPPQLPQIRPADPVAFPWAEKPLPPSGHLPLSEIVPNREAGDNNVPLSRPGNENKAVLHKKTKSAVSLKSLRNYMERKDAKVDETRDAPQPELTPKKAKSANSLSAILKRSQRGRKDESKEGRDKENRSPTDLVDSMPSPLWPQDSNPLYKQASNRSRQNSTTDRRRSVADEVSLYTPKGYSPAHQRNFYDYHQPSLTRTGEGKSRPKSESLVGNKKPKDLAMPALRPPVMNNNVDRVDSASSRNQRLEATKRNSGQAMPIPASPEKQKEKEPGRLSRVQAAISAFNAKEKEADVQKHLDSKNVESEFERLLVSFVSMDRTRDVFLTVLKDARNIPHNMRDRMRSLDTNIKVDFIQKSEIVTPLSAGASDSRRGRGNESKDEKTQDRKGSRSRSRSRGFTFGRGSSSPSKKTRPESGSFSRPRSIDFSQPVGVYSTLHPGGSTTSVGDATAVDTAADPSDFVHYLREIQKPEMVEVGKIHKLRLLLRNETVGWVDDFITEGGMNEIVQLIYRIMKMEWR